MITKPILAATLLATTALAAQAETLRWARAGDSLTLDPHAQNEGPTHVLQHQLSEPLLIRDQSSAFEPALATDWAVKEDDPNVWVFNLREGVTFHEGQDFTAEDVVFSIERAQSEASAMKELLTSIVEVRAVDDHTVEFVTDGPNPILPSNLTNLFIMDKGWTEENDTVAVQDIAAGETNYATTNVNGTGPYRLVSREADVRTVLEQNPDYWGIDEFPMEVTRIEYTPIQNAATRVAALLSGEVDFIQDVPVQDLGRIGETGTLVVKTAPQNRTIFFGMNVGADDLERDRRRGREPIRRPARARGDEHGDQPRGDPARSSCAASPRPQASSCRPSSNGWTEALDALPEGDDGGRAWALMEEAGYGDGFSVQLDCPNDRYVNDEAICQAVVGMLGQIGIDVNLNAQGKALHFPLIQNGTTDFYMLGWGVPTYDSEYIFNFLVHTKDDERGSWNPTGYSRRRARREDREPCRPRPTLETSRNATIAEIWGDECRATRSTCRCTTRC